ncbi:hypothetical protein FJ548_25310 [Mesorhizobium sp. B2-4-17]|nr:hypothetical protein FJ548_25310 [Mesorhizobium sp. B2-4-17]
MSPLGTPGAKILVAEWLRRGLQIPRRTVVPYGFVPMKVPADFDVWGLFHAVDERIPGGAGRSRRRCPGIVGGGRSRRSSG